MSYVTIENSSSKLNYLKLSLNTDPYQGTWISESMLRLYPLSEKQRELLITRHSMMSTMEKISQESLKVHVKAEGWDHAGPEILNFLKHKHSITVWKRHVEICGKENCYMIATSLVSPHGLEHHFRRICFLNETPIGKFLHHDPHILRGDFEFLPLDSGKIWARRSLFKRECCSLALIEYFLPSLLSHAK